MEPGPAGGDAAATAADDAAELGIIVELIGADDLSTSANSAVAKVPPTKASSSRIEGSAIRRLAVKKSARPQAVAATNKRREEGRAVVARSTRPTAWPMLWPIQPTANNRIAAAIDTKISLKPVSSRNCSSSGMRSTAAATCARSASAASAVITPDGDCVVELLLAVHYGPPVWDGLYAWCIIMSTQQALVRLQVRRSRIQLCGA